jgi:hypothetical protein
MKEKKYTGHNIFSEDEINNTIDASTLPVLDTGFGNEAREQAGITGNQWTKGFSTDKVFDVGNLNYVIGIQDDVLSEVQTRGILNWNDKILYPSASKDSFVVHIGNLYQQKSHADNIDKEPGTPAGDDFWELFQAAPTTGTVSTVDLIKPEVGGDIPLNADNVAIHNPGTVGPSANTYMIPLITDIARISSNTEYITGIISGDAISGKVDVGDKNTPGLVTVWQNDHTISGSLKLGYDGDNIIPYTVDGKLSKNIIPRVQINRVEPFVTNLSADTYDGLETVMFEYLTGANGWMPDRAPAPVNGDMAVLVGTLTNQPEGNVPVEEFKICTNGDDWQLETSWTDMHIPIGVVSWAGEVGVITTGTINEVVSKLPTIIGLADNISILSTSAEYLQEEVDAICGWVKPLYSVSGFANSIGPLTPTTGPTAGFNFDDLETNNILVYNEADKKFTATKVLIFADL